MLNKEIVKRHLQVGVGALGHRPQFVIKDDHFLTRPRIRSLVPDDRIYSFDIAPPLFVIEAIENIPSVVIVDLFISSRIRSPDPISLREKVSAAGPFMTRETREI